MLTKAPRGTKDVLPSESYKWQYVENLMREICEFYGYKEIRTPGFEHTELFLRGVGESTDIVRKEMYTFNDRSGRSITLKAEGTSPAVRAFIEHGLYAETQPTKLYYITPVYRYEKPQAGRLREHHQFGVEIFGAKSASADAEVISIAMTLLKKLGLNNLELRINSVGCPVCRKNYNKVLKEFLKEHLDELCDDCKVRYEVNPLRVLDCKVESCRRVTGEAPLITDYLCDDCRNHFEELKKYLDAMGYDYIVDPRIVRGLDYYTKTAFEIISKDIGAQGTVCGGGRYDGLIEECGGPSMPGVGFGMGIERLLLTLEQNGIEIPKPEGPDLFIAYIGDEAKLFTFTLANKLRFNGLKVEIDHMERSLKAQMKYANKLNAKFAVVIGKEELESKKVKLKNMATGEETEILIDEIEKAIKKLNGGSLMGEQLGGLKRTHMCGELGVKDVGKSVVVMGWVNSRRDHGGLVFIDLRDRTGIVQIVFSEQVSKEAFEKVQSVRSEYVLAVEGEVVKRLPENVNPKILTGEIEIYAKNLKILSKSETPPFPIEDRSNVSEAVRLKYRYLDLRRPSMQKNLITRFKLTQAVREFLNDNGFIEIETPMLIKSTPEGARDYLVPSRIYPGKFYALPQSPQIFKQLLMIAGFDRYYQIARCLRDEDLRADRQPEFTQIDIEMSFVEVEDVLDINEKMIKHVFKKVLDIDLDIPFRRLTYQEAMERFGTDKPDLRFGMELKDLSDILRESEFNVFKNALKNGGSIRGINVKGAASMTRKQLDELVEFAKNFGAKGLLWMQVLEGEVKSPATKFLTEGELNKILERLEAEVGDLLLIVADKDEVVFDTLGHLRVEMAKRFNLIDESKYEFVWVVDFPLLEYDEEEKRYVAKHHPFTSPKDEDIDLLEKEPLKVRAKAYDIVLNGTEIGGGSIRIHDTELQKRMFKVLGFSEEEAWKKFGFLMEAFKYGAPPHGGIAYGLDRLAMIMTGSDTIRDVIAFPKTQNAVCLMSDAPSEVSEKQLKELHIKIDL